MATKNVADRAPAYAMPGEVIDGNDIVAVYESAKRAIDWARSGKGPYLVEYKTFRMTGHSAHDDAGYVPSELFDEWAKKDPIDRFQKHLIKAGELTEQEIEQMESEITALIDDAVDWAEKSPYPDPADVTKDVYYEDQ